MPVFFAGARGRLGNNLSTSDCVSINTQCLSASSDLFFQNTGGFTARSRSEFGASRQRNASIPFVVQSRFSTWLDRISTSEGSTVAYASIAALMPAMAAVAMDEPASQIPG